MKRSKVLWLISNQLDFLNGKFDGARDFFTIEELKKADVILNTLEAAGMKAPERFYEIMYDNEMCTVSSLTWESE